MDVERLKHNPSTQPLSLVSGRAQTNYAAAATATSRAMPADAPKPATSPILDRFRELLRIREEEIRVYDPIAPIPPPTMDEIVLMYEDVLSELTFNSKPVITDLTTVAGEQREHGEGIADAICARIIEVPVELKLPSLYLLDSIVKSIGGEYIRYFSSQLPEVFCEAYRQVQPRMHSAMRHLFGTWSTVFPSSVLYSIEAELQFSPSAVQQPVGGIGTSESPRPAHGIHVNPKYLEVRRQYDSPSNASEVREDSAYKVYGKKPVAVYDDFDYNQVESTVPNIAGQRLSSGGYGSGTSLPLGDYVRSSSPSIDDYPVSKSPSRIIERASPSRAGFIHGLHRMTGGDGEAVNLRRGHGFENSSVQANGNKHDRTRALIDAYGRDNGQRTLDENPRKVRPLVNGLDGKMVTRPWQHTEEEEFDWQDLNPALADSRGTEQLPSGNISRRPGVGALGLTALTPTLRRNWPGGAHVPYVEDSPKLAEDSAPALDGGRRSAPKHFRHETTRMSHSVNPQSAWNTSERRFPSHMPQNKIPGPNEYVNLNGGSKNNLTKLPPLPAAQGGMIHSHHSVRPPASFQHQFLSPHDPRGSAGLSSMHPIPSQTSNPLSQGYTATGFAVGLSSQLMSSAPGLHPSIPPPPPGNSFQAQGMMPPLPPGRPPSQPQILSISQFPISNPNPPPAAAYSGLISSLVAQGLISMSNQATVQDSIGVEFDPDFLKVRHESAVRALYADLPRQCTTCGHRFKTQEEHSKHMDWHVTKNRLSRNRRQNASRKWYVSTTMWLSSAEALGTDAGPGFLPTDTAEEKQEEEELAVPADENQTTCALCGEPFEDFYSDETDEWMYRGAVYLNAPGRSAVGVDSSQLGPIAHAKCRSESSAVPSRDFANHGEAADEGSQRKRMRT